MHSKVSVFRSATTVLPVSRTRSAAGMVYRKVAMVQVEAAAQA